MSFVLSDKLSTVKEAVGYDLSNLLTTLLSIVSDNGPGMNKVPERIKLRIDCTSLALLDRIGVAVAGD